MSEKIKEEIGVNLFGNSEDIIVTGYFKGISKKTGRPFAILSTSIPYPEEEIGRHGDSVKYGHYNNDLFCPDNVLDKLTPSIIGSKIDIIYKTTAGGPRVSDIKFMDIKTGDIIV